MEVGAATCGPTGHIHRGATLRPADEADQRLFAGRLPTAHARTRGLMTRLFHWLARRIRSV
jgi:hypothetical protein